MKYWCHKDGEDCDYHCNCDGCWDCTGHEHGCTCDVNWDELAESRNG